MEDGRKMTFAMTLDLSTGFVNTGHFTKHTGGTGSGSCATSSAASGTPIKNQNPTSGTPGGNTNSCSSNSIGATITSFQDKSGSGSSVSCSSHSP